jgi:regulator of PEP synthase PpsR (kinase-PPPase family)
MKSFHLHLVSDSTGETVSSVSRAALAQFEDSETQEHVWSLVRTQGQLDKVIAGLDEYSGPVMYTFVNRELRKTLRQACLERHLPCIPILGPVIRELSAYLNEEASEKPGHQHELSENYFKRVEAINYTLSHDDGQGHWELESADIVLVGVSRTSKSPTCIYLANRGYKTANIPYVGECPLPEKLFELKQLAEPPLIVGLTISLDRLLQIRKTRLLSLNQQEDTNYVDSEVVEAEIDAAKKLFRKEGWPIIDVTRRSVEETAALIIQYSTKLKAAQ